MSLRFKDGVRVGRGPSTQLLLIFIIAEAVYREHGRDCVVTSLDDSTHHTVSRHYLGDGGDLRTNDIPPDETRDIYMDILTRLEPLGPEFRVLLEYVGEPREHLHVEYRAMLTS